MQHPNPHVVLETIEAVRNLESVPVSLSDLISQELLEGTKNPQVFVAALKFRDEQEGNVTFEIRIGMRFMHWESGQSGYWRPTRGPLK
ncbi:MAG: hypothetical protein WDZ29_01405 [Balneolaceae bacterium]